MHTPGEIGVCFSNKKAPVARFRPTVEGREGGSVPGARARLVAAGRLVVGRARRQLHRRERHAGDAAAHRRPRPAPWPRVARYAADACTSSASWSTRCRKPGSPAAMSSASAYLHRVG